MVSPPSTGILRNFSHYVYTQSLLYKVLISICMIRTTAPELNYNLILQIVNI